MLIEELDVQRSNPTKESIQEMQRIHNEIAEKSSRFFELIPQENYRTTPIAPIYREYLRNNYARMIHNLIYLESATKIILGSSHA